MTRKDYIAIAKAMRTSNVQNLEHLTTEQKAGASTQWLIARANLADMLGKDNSRFDVQRFYAACEGGN